MLVSYRTLALGLSGCTAWKEKVKRQVQKLLED